LKTSKGLGLLILFYALFSSGNIYSDDIYPGKTIYFIPSIQAGLTVPLSADSRPGGIVQSDLVVRGFFSEMLNLGFSGEYRFYNQSGITSISAGAGITGGYTFILPSGFSITPDAGLNLIIPISPSPTVFPELDIGCRFNLHLYNRSKIFIDANLCLPFSELQSPLLSFGIGIKESNPAMIPLPEINPELLLSTELFSPDNDGENDTLDIRLNIESPSSVKSWTLKIIDKMNNPVFQREGSRAPEQDLKWNGYSDTGILVSSADDLEVEFIITDKIGRTDILRENFVVDVLIFRENGKYKINIPNIIFPPQSADFAGLTDTEDINKNNQILLRLSEIFKRFSDYSIHIEGHANSEHWRNEEEYSKEQENELLPLSLSRARKIKEGLVILGIDESRVTVEGLGAALPVVPFEDGKNNWKNRRVEFILVK